MHGPLSGQLLVSAIWSLVGVVAVGRNQIGKAQIHVPTLSAYSLRQCQGHGQTQETLTIADCRGMTLMVIWLSCRLDPNHITSVLVGLSLSLLADIQSLMSLTQSVKRWTACAASRSATLMYKQVVIHSLQWHGQPFVVSGYVLMRYRSYNDHRVRSSWQNEIHKNGIE